jgi:hypothetical protein
MAMTIAPTALTDLEDTVVGGWLRRLAGKTSPRRNHWQTKLIYYRAATSLLEAEPHPVLTWKSVVAAAGPRGCRSTFYEVAGGHARHRMVDDLIGDGRSDSIQIALRYLRADPVEQLIDEAKVWSFWPYRQRLTRELGAGLTHDEVCGELTAAVADWARRHERLARAVGDTPPACAVEDLTVLHQGRLSGTQAANRLTDAVRQSFTCG